MLPDFDPETYIDRVLRPMGRGTDGSLPDVVVRYALDQFSPDAADQDLIRRVDEVVNLWLRQEEGGTAGLAEACRRCLVEDSRLREQAAYRDPRWWRGRINDWRGFGQPDGASSAFPPPSGGHAERPSATEEPDQQPASEPPEPAETIELPPPTNLTATARDDRVILRWQGSPEAPADVSFAVERLTSTGARQFVGATPNTSIADLDPPGGRTVSYTVLAVQEATGARSAAALVEAVFTPPVTDLVAGQELDGRVAGHWKMHRDAWRAEAWRIPYGTAADRADGQLIQARKDGFDDPQPPPGRYIYRVAPVYRDQDVDQTYRGRPAEAEVEVFDEPPQPHVSVAGSGEHEPARVALRWGELPDGMFLLMRCSAVEPAGAAGELLMVDRAKRLGMPVWSGQGFTGTTANLALPAGRWVLIPFAVAGVRAVRGNCLNVDVIPPVRSPEAVRNGPNVQVSWVWPEGLRLARLVWRAEGADGFSREITRSEFQSGGGMTFERSEAASIRITGVVRSGADELTSAAVTVTAEAQRPTLTYHVKPIPGLAGRLPWSRRRRVVLLTDLHCVGLRAVIYVHAPSAGRESDIELAVSDDLTLGPGRSQDVTVTIPTADEMARPCYISCRATTGSGEVRVDDFASTGREIR